MSFATSGAMSFLRSQFTKLPYPTKRFTDQTIIVTGSNVGMGLEAARYFVRLEASKVILAVRSIPKGNEAKKSIEDSEKRLGVVEVWELDLSKYASVKAFAEEAKGLERLDVVVENAGMFTDHFVIAEENESTVTVNVVSTMLLGSLLLPKLRETAVRFKKTPVLTFTGSFVHGHTSFPERKTENIFQGLADEKTARMNDRYKVSKLIELFCVRELANQLSKSTKEGRIIISVINPGFVATNLMREKGFVYNLWFQPSKKIMSRTAEEGGRTLVHAAEGGEETHGQYLDDCKIGRVSTFVSSDEGAETQKRLWKELSEKLDKIQPGLMQSI